MFFLFLLVSSSPSLSKLANIQKDSIDASTSTDLFKTEPNIYDYNKDDLDKDQDLLYDEELQAPEIPEIDETPEVQTGIYNDIEPNFDNRFDRWNRQPDNPKSAWKRKKEEIWKKVHEIENHFNQEEMDEDNSEMAKQIKKIEENLDKEKFMLEHENKIKEYNQKESKRREIERKYFEKRKEELERKEKEKKNDFERRAEERIEFEKNENEKRRLNGKNNEKIQHKTPADDENVEKEERLSHNMNKELEEPVIPDTPNEEKSKSEMGEDEKQIEIPKLKMNNQFIFAIAIVFVAVGVFKFSTKYIKRFFRKKFKNKRSDDLPL